MSITPFPAVACPIPELVMNVMTVDVEDYFQVSAFDEHVSRHDWDRLESRVCANTERLLALLEYAEVTATFFVLGWVAERYPGLVRRIAAAGHEIASHGYAHRLVYDLSIREFREDLRRARGALEDACGRKIVGYRAPSYSITERSLWAYDVLLDEGYEYDASVFPIYHDRYGIPGAPRHPHRIERDGAALWELPGSTVRWAGQNLPFAGGGYFRILPYAWTRRAFAHVNRQGNPVVFYLHPWEIDPDQPRVRASVLSRFRHYHNLGETESRLQHLLEEFSFGTVSSVLSGLTLRHPLGASASVAVAPPLLSSRKALDLTWYATDRSGESAAGNHVPSSAFRD